VATIGTGNPTLLDLVKRTDPNGSIASVVELLTQRNAILEDMTFKEGNLTTGERVSSRVGLPSLTWRRFNEGVAPSKSAVVNFDESCGMLEGMSVVDTELAKLGGNEAAFRASEDAAFLQALNNEVNNGLFYHSTKTAPEKFMGLAPRFDALSGGIASANTIDWSGSSSGDDQTSVWFVVWSPDSVYGIFPKGMNGGLQAEDLGKQLWTDSGGTNKFTAWVTKWTWKVGLVVKDWRQVVRICNIDTSAMTAGSGSTTIVDDMIDAYYKLNDPNAGRLVIYCNRAVGAMLHKQAMNKATYGLTLESFGGKPVTAFLGHPIRVTDSILSTESVVS
jgi:hypothetical protein